MMIIMMMVMMRMTMHWRIALVETGGSVRYYPSTEWATQLTQHFLTSHHLHHHHDHHANAAADDDDEDDAGAI